MEREFTVAVFVVHQGRVLLHWHRRLGRWLPPGGHIDPGELPDEAAVRETLEETGLAIELVDATGAVAPAGPGDPPTPRRLTQPLGIQLEDIPPDHQHIDLIYLARPHPPAPDDPDDPGGAGGGALRAEASNPEGRPDWFTPAAWRALPVSAEIDRWASAAVAALENRP